MYLEAQVRNRSPHVAGWAHVSHQEIEQLGEFGISSALRRIAAQLPGLVAGAVGHHHRGRSAEATLFAWMVCEQLLNYGWRETVIAHARSKSHRDQLEGNRTYTAAVRAEMLRRAGWLDDDVMDLVNDARKVRNRQAHRHSVSLEDATTVMAAMLAMVRLALPEPGDQVDTA
jgi:hypothetical protein